MASISPTRVTRIVHIIDSLGSGGAERQVVNLVRGTSRERFSHVVCCLRDEPDFFARAVREAGAEVVGLGLRGKHPWGAAALRLRHLFRSRRPDVVQTWLYDASVSTRIAMMFDKHPPLVTALQVADYHPDVVAAAGWPRGRKEVLRWIDKASAAWAGARFVACSRFVERTVGRALGVAPTRMNVIYNCIEPRQLACPPDARERVRSELRVPPDALVCVHVGRLAPEKAHDTLLRAFRDVAEADPRAYLLLVGGGPLDAALGALADELGISTRVRFAGVRSDVAACMEAADAFVFPSLVEGMPVALLEAMFKGLPCIASAIPPIVEVVNGAGLLVPPRAVQALADAMLRLLRHPDLRSCLGAHAREEAVRRFHSDVVVPQWEDLYIRLTASA